MAKRKTPAKKPKPQVITRYTILSQCVGTLAGLDHQLGFATHLDELDARIGWLQLHAPPDLSEDDAKTLEHLRDWARATRQNIGAFRTKLSAMVPQLNAAGETVRKGVAQ